MRPVQRCQGLPGRSELAVVADAAQVGVQVEPVDLPFLGHRWARFRVVLILVFIAVSPLSRSAIRHGSPRGVRRGRRAR